MRAFYDLGLWGQEEVDVGDRRIVPRELFHTLFEPKVTFAGEEDVIVLRVKALGKKDGRDAEVTVELIDYFDEQTGFSAMERATGWSAAIVGAMMARGETPLGCAGVESQVPAGPYVRALRQRGLNVTEQVEFR